MNFKNRSGGLGGRPFTEEEPIDQELTIKMPKSMKEKIRSKAARRRGSLMDNGDQWREQVAGLIELVAREKRWRSAMGMPDGWREHPIWR